MDNTCIGCGKPLKLQPELGAYACQSAGCNLAGKAVQPCEICQRYSVTGSRCQNATCPAFDRARETCPDCIRHTLIAISGLKTCLNGECKSNSGLDDCWFCQQKTLSRVQHRSPLYTCRSADCSVVLKLIRPCPVCNQNSFDLHQGRCLNAGCPTAGARVRECPSCGRKRYFGDADDENKCANPKCKQFMGDPIDASAGDGLATVNVMPDAARSGAKEVAKIAKAGVGASSTGVPPSPPKRKDKPDKPDKSEKRADIPAPPTGIPQTGVDQTLQMNFAEVQNAIRTGLGQPPAKASATGGTGANGDAIEERATAGLDDAEDNRIMPLPTIGAGPLTASREFSRLDVAAERDQLDAAPPPRRSGATARRDAAAKPSKENDISGFNQPAIDERDFEEKPSSLGDEAWQGGDGNSWKPAESGQVAAWEVGETASEPARIDRGGFIELAPGESENRLPIDARLSAAAAAAIGDDTLTGVPTIGKKPIVPDDFESALPPGPQDVEPPEPFGFGSGIGSGFGGETTLSRSDEEEMQLGSASEVDFHSAFKYLQQTWINPPGQKPTPLYLVIGLAGVGKTCFLTMLGQVLQGTRFYTPRDDIKPQLVRIESRYRVFIRDLVYDFSSARFDEYLATGLWPPADIPGQTSEFLVTELLTANGDLARLATLEISGEVYQEFLPRVAEIYQDPTTVERLSPDHRIIWELMQHAEGIVVLLEGSQDINTRTQIYGQFFQALYQWKSAEVRRKLDEQYERFLELKEEDYPMSLRVVARQFRDTGSLSFDEFSGEVRRNAQRCMQTLEDQGINTMMMQHYAIFDELRLYYSMVDPDFLPLKRLQGILQNDPSLKDTSNQLQAYENFLKGFLKKFSGDKAFLEQVYQRKAEASSATAITDDWPIFQRYVCWHYGLDESELQLHDVAMSNASRAKGAQPFEQLRYLSIVFTKTDKDFAIYPASNFPRVVNVDWAAPLPRLGNFLTLCNGYLRYYNSSITGYSVRKDAGFQLGRRGTLTPINIAEPLLDMLTFTGNKDLFDGSGGSPKF
ncbi:MAG: hypothetical protein AB7K09_16060 [Planctomycetota bacterium]